jgi:hypothetical protein
LMNQNWIVEVAGEPRRYFVKVPGAGSETFIDRVGAGGGVLRPRRRAGDS